MVFARICRKRILESEISPLSRVLLPSIGSYHQDPLIWTKQIHDGV